MPGKSNVYTLGEFGVNRVKSPIHLIDGELLTAQNADVPFDKGNRGLRKRSGLAKLNTDVAAGSIASMTWVPLADPFGTLYFYTGSVPSWSVSQTGTTFASQLAPSVSAQIGTQSNPGFVTHRGRMYFVVGTTLVSFGSDQILMTHATISAAITSPSLFVDSTAETIYGLDSTTGASLFGGMVFSYNVLSGAYAEAAAPAGATHRAVGGLDGVLYTGASDLIRKYVGTTWSTELATTVGTTANSFLRGPDGKLYAALTNASGGAAMVIIRRDSAGSWTTVQSDASGSTYDDLCLTASGVFYAAKSSNRHVYRSTDGTTWVDDEDLSGSLATLRHLFAWNDLVFAISGNSDITPAYAQRDLSGNWTTTLGTFLGGGHL